jgi:hypothetical protein
MTTRNTARTTARRTALLVVSAVSLCGAVSPALAAEAKSKPTEQAAVEKAGEGAGAVNHKAAQRAGEIAHKAAASAEEMAKNFESFCGTWMDKLRERERYNVEHIVWQPGAVGVVGEYVGYDTTHTNSVKADPVKGHPIGTVVYRELKFRLTGKSETEALASKPELIEQTEVTELFQFNGRNWAY